LSDRSPNKLILKKAPILKIKNGTLLQDQLWRRGGGVSGSGSGTIP
jgi:hypothetical protein